MKAGSLIHVIDIERGTNTVNAAGTPIFTWERIATLRAEVVKRTTEEFLQSAGETDETRIVFRIRYTQGLSNDDRIVFQGRHFDIREITFIGRRDGLEIRCVATEDDT